MKPRKVLYQLFILLVVFFGCCLLAGEICQRPRQTGTAAQPSGEPTLWCATQPLSFEVNQGQMDRIVDFTARGKGYGLFLTRDEMVLQLQKSGTRSRKSEHRGNHLGLIHEFQRTINHGQQATDLGRSSVLRLKLLNANPSASIAGLNALPGKANYFIGNDPQKWRTNISTYARVRYQGVYPGIDVIYYGNQGGQLEYDFVVAPGADPDAITLGVWPEGGRDSDFEDQESAGSTSFYIAESGDLVIPSSTGSVRIHRPIVYQEQDPEAKSETRSLKLEVRNSAVADQHSRVFNRQPAIGNRQFREGRFVVDARNHVRFALGPYDRTQPLIIDPVLYYSTNLGGSSGGDFGAIAVDSSGSAYVTGGTSSTEFPTLSPLEANLNGSADCFVSKLSSDGSALIYSTYLGGSNIDYCTGIAVDASGNAYVTGETWSTDFPTVDPFQATNQTGTPDSASVTAFVSKLNSVGAALIYSTYLGGSTQDTASGIAVDASGSAYVTGTTFSSDFSTFNAFQANCNNCSFGDAFVTKFSPSGAALAYSTFLGGSAGASANGIAVDAAGEACLTGLTRSYDFPTVNPLQPNNHSSQGSAFITKFNAAGSALVYSTYLGGGGMDAGASIAVDSSSNVYVTGTTTSTAFPIVDPFQSSPSSSGAAFVSNLNPSGSALLYSTYLDGAVGSDSSTEVSTTGAAIAVDANGNAYVTGETDAVDFPTLNAIQPTCPDVSEGCGSAYATEFNSTGTALVYSTYLGGSSYSVGYGIAVDSAGNTYVTGENDATDFPGAPPLPPNPPGAGQTFVVKIAGSPEPGAALTLSTGLLTFANQPIGMASNVETVVLRSVGAKPLNITNVSISGDFAFVSTGSTCPYGGGTVASGTFCSIDINFTPTESGTRTGAVVITDNAGGSPQSVSLAGVGLALYPNAVVSPTTLTFASQWANNSSAPESVTLSNTGNAALTVTSIALIDKFNQPLTGLFNQANNCGTSVAAGAACTINVTFEPSQGGPQSATLVITDDTDGHPNSTQSVNLSGACEDFNLGWVADSPPGNLSVGQTGVYTWAVTSVGGFNHSVAFSCSITFWESLATNLVPLNPTCTVSPTVITPTGTPTNVAVTVLMSEASGSALNKPSAPRRGIPASKVVLLLAALLATAVWRLRGRRQTGAYLRRSSLVLLAAGLLLLAGLVGCGAGNYGCGSDDQDCVLLHTGSTWLVTLKGTATAGSTTLTNSTGTEVYVPDPN